MDHSFSFFQRDEKFPNNFSRTRFPCIGDIRTITLKKEKKKAGYVLPWFNEIGEALEVRDHQTAFYQLT